MRVSITLIDTEEGTVDVKLEFDPAIDANTRSPAANLAAALLNALKAESEYSDD